MLQAVNALVSFAVITALFAMIYKMLPGVNIAWSDVWIGAGVTSLLFTIGKTLIGLYIGKTALASSFGAAGTFVVVIVWVYYSSLVFLLGAEFTHVYARRHGSLYRAANAEAAGKGGAPGEHADLRRARPAGAGQPRAVPRRRG